jgi:leucyl aminopeptidase
MRISMQLSFAAPSVAGPGVLVVGVAEGAGLAGLAADADAEAGGALKRALGVTRFAGKPGQAVEVLAPTGLKATRILLVGLGKPQTFDASAAERVAAGVVGRLFTSGEKELTFAIDAPK